MARLRYRREPESDAAAEKFHHNVYVILLDPKVARHPTILRINPKRDPAKPCVYVGMSGLPPEHRSENHKQGYKVAWSSEMSRLSVYLETDSHWAIFCDSSSSRTASTVFSVPLFFDSVQSSKLR
jgi:hypothetical protein